MDWAYKMEYPIHLLLNYVTLGILAFTPRDTHQTHLYRDHAGCEEYHNAPTKEVLPETPQGAGQSPERADSVCKIHLEVGTLLQRRQLLRRNLLWTLKLLMQSHLLGNKKKMVKKNMR